MKIAEHKSARRRETFTINGKRVMNHVYSREWLRILHEPQDNVTTGTVMQRNGTVTKWVNK